MKVSVEIIKGLQRKLTVNLPAAQLDKACQQRLRTLAKSTKLDGFRKGKVPVKVIQQRYGERVKQEVLTDLIQRSYAQAVRQEKLNPVGVPQIDSQPTASGEDVWYTAVFEIYPEFEIADLRHIKINKPLVEITDRDVENTLQKLRRQRADWKPVQRAAGKGDQVIIDFNGTISGEAINGGKGVDVPLILGDGQMPVDFESQLEGLMANRHRAITIKYPEDSGDESLRGKTAVFDVTCKQVLEPKLPELDDAFANVFGVTDGSLMTLRVEIRQQLENELAKGMRAYLTDQVMNGLVGLHTIELPDTLVNNQLKQLQREALQQGLGETELQKLPREKFEARARWGACLKLIIGRVIKEKKIQADQKTVQELIREAVAEYENPDELYKSYLSNRKALQHFQALAIEKRIVDDVLKAADITEQSLSFDELMNLARNSAWGIPRASHAGF